MKPNQLLILLFLILGHINALLSQRDSAAKALEPDPPLVITDHQIRTPDGTVLKYQATTGYLSMKTETGEPRAKIFFIAYRQSGAEDPANRPITFSFNGGPGSSSVWLHMGALGPKRVIMTEKGETLEPPYRMDDNLFTWLTFTDLVFIDPVMTGFSRPEEGVDKKEFLGYEEDIESVGQFIHLYVSKFKRWASPKYLAGESYGTTRACGLSGHLQDRYGMYLSGLVLVSQISNFQTARFVKGNDLPFILFLPSFAATGWYHEKLDPKFSDLESLLDEVRLFAENEYASALMKGDRLSFDERDRIAEKIALYTGLSPEFVLHSNLRINVSRFTKELRRGEDLTVGRLDSRFTGRDYDSAGDNYEFDPSYNMTIYGPYTAMVRDYLSRDLGFESELPYEILTGRAGPWNYNNVQNRYLNVSETLRSAIHKNPSLEVLICNGYYDLATPFFATEYTVDHMFVHPQWKDNLQLTYYEAGHMMYIHEPSLKQFYQDVKSFYLSE